MLVRLRSSSHQLDRFRDTKTPRGREKNRQRKRERERERRDVGKSDAARYRDASIGKSLLACLPACLPAGCLAQAPSNKTILSEHLRQLSIGQFRWRETSSHCIHRRYVPCSCRAQRVKLFASFPTPGSELRVLTDTASRRTLKFWFTKQTGEILQLNEQTMRIRIRLRLNLHIFEQLCYVLRARSLVESKWKEVNPNGGVDDRTQTDDAILFKGTGAAFARCCNHPGNNHRNLERDTGGWVVVVVN